MQMTPRQLHNTQSGSRWRNRSKRWLKHHPLCVMCEKENCIEAAEVCDHIEPHHGDMVKFRTGALQSLCKRHHDSSKKRIENKGYVNDIDINGEPKDRNHPWWRDGTA
jgi:hypothetical protein